MNPHPRSTCACNFHDSSIIPFASPLHPMQILNPIHHTYIAFRIQLCFSFTCTRWVSVSFQHTSSDRVTLLFVSLERVPRVPWTILRLLDVCLIEYLRQLNLSREMLIVRSCSLRSRSQSAVYVFSVTIAMSDRICAVDRLYRFGMKMYARDSVRRDLFGFSAVSCIGLRSGRDSFRLILLSVGKTRFCRSGCWPIFLYPCLSW